MTIEVNFAKIDMKFIYSAFLLPSTWHWVFNTKININWKILSYVCSLFRKYEPLQQAE